MRKVWGKIRKNYHNLGKNEESGTLAHPGLWGELKTQDRSLKQQFQLPKRLPKWCKPFVKNGYKKNPAFVFGFCFVLFCFVLFFFVKKLKIWCSLDHMILSKFHSHTVQPFFKECILERLETSKANISNGTCSMEEL